ncbi:hypothetical protein N7532_012127 [Penicillium argentinense]|uniref:Uncharacterized protein n=1 Tax=Penicillium argentinense TaxID=1131581 RepID=A0A9W9JV87_9EURO|nr:uncharacterized protein N7532_012127 [Penicillium argentinense]KAJ5083084.1 hypothetical protein N7532_012127 [Penicillium argentinense]
MNANGYGGARVLKLRQAGPQPDTRQAVRAVVMRVLETCGGKRGDPSYPFGQVHQEGWYHVTVTRDTFRSAWGSSVVATNLRASVGCAPSSGPHADRLRAPTVALRRPRRTRDADPTFPGPGDEQPLSARTRGDEAHRKTALSRPSFALQLPCITAPA